MLGYMEPISPTGVGVRKTIDFKMFTYSYDSSHLEIIQGADILLIYIELSVNMDIIHVLYFMDIVTAQMDLCTNNYKKLPLTVN
jgi:hypothetical protein